MVAWVDAIHLPVGTGIVVCEPNGPNPNGTYSTQTCLVGDTEDIKWRSYGNLGTTVTIEYSDDGKASWHTISSAASNGGPDGALRTYPWTIPNLYSTDCWVRVTPNASPADFGDSAAAIVIHGQDEDFENGFNAWPWTVGSGWSISGTSYRGGAAAAYTGGGDSAIEVTLDFDCAGFIGFFCRKDGNDDALRFKIDGNTSAA
jgi:hypothetical protein